MAKATKAQPQERVTIPAPNLKVAQFTIRGTAPLVIHKFSKKAKDTIHEGQAAGSTAKKGKKREKRDFKADYEGAMYRCDGWHGINAASFRNAMISACRLVGFKMTLGKLSVFTEADGYDNEDNQPLVKITKGQPKYYETPARNSNGGMDLRARPMWDPGWEAKPRFRFDADQFTLQDVANLLMRAGMQVGIAEGRPGSRMSNGMGFGLFEIVQQKEV